MAAFAEAMTQENIPRIVSGDEALMSRLLENGLGPAPVGHLMRWQGSDRWVRFHFFESKRYPENPSDDEALFSMFQMIGNSMFSQGQSLVVCHWCQLQGDEDDERDVYSVETRQTKWEPSGWRERILDVAHFEIGLTILCPETLTAIAPYDGGFDVFARDAAERDNLRVTFAGWLSRHPSGL